MSRLWYDDALTDRAEEICDRFHMCVAEAGYPEIHACLNARGHFYAWHRSPRLSAFPTEDLARVIYRAWNLAGLALELTEDEFAMKAPDR